MKKKLLGGLAVAAVLAFGVTSFNKCPWLQKQWAENVAPVLSSQ